MNRECETKYFSRTLRYGQADGTKNLVSLEEKTKPSLRKPKALNEQNISVFVLFDMDKNLNYVFISVKHDSWSFKGDLIKFQARNIMRENFNFSHETREEDGPRERPLFFLPRVRTYFENVVSSVTGSCPLLFSLFRYKI